MKKLINLKYCTDFVRETNKERFYFGVFFPEKQKDLFFCVNALNIELATIKSKQISYNSGILRMKWWKEEIKNSILGKPTRVPVLEALSEEAAKYKLTFTNFREILKWREIDLSWKQPVRVFF
jgi:phytoene/squalene synthetase